MKIWIKRFLESKKDTNQKNGSGGDGGDIFIAAKNIIGNGKITADGGNGSVGGRGGKIIVLSEDNQFKGEVSARGGRSYSNYLSFNKVFCLAVGFIFLSIIIIIKNLELTGINLGPLYFSEKNNQKIAPNIEQNHSGSGDNVAEKNEYKIQNAVFENKKVYLTENLKIELLKSLNNFKDLRIALVTVLTGQYANEYGSEIKAFLESNGFNVSFGAVAAAYYKGIQIIPQMNKDEKFIAIFLGQDIEKYGIVDKLNNQ